MSKEEKNTIDRLKQSCPFGFKGGLKNTALKKTWTFLLPKFGKQKEAGFVQSYFSNQKAFIRIDGGDNENDGKRVKIKMSEFLKVPIFVMRVTNITQGNSKSFTISLEMVPSREAGRLHAQHVSDTHISGAFCF